MAIEIERKFLVKYIPNEDIKFSHYIKQGYIAKNQDTVIRVRQRKIITLSLLKEIKSEFLVLNLNILFQKMMQKYYLKTFVIIR